MLTEESATISCDTNFPVNDRAVRTCIVQAASQAPPLLLLPLPPPPPPPPPPLQLPLQLLLPLQAPAPKAVQTNASDDAEDVYSL